MKVTMLSVMCGPEGNAFRGTVLDVKDDVGKELIENKFARPYDSQKDAKPKQIGLARAASQDQ